MKAASIFGSIPIAASIIYNVGQKNSPLNLTVACQKNINEDSLLKIRVKETGDLDLALVTKLSPDCSLTFCTGMETAEHSDWYWQQKDAQEEGDQDKEIDGNQKLQREGKLWGTPYFGLNFVFRF